MSLHFPATDVGGQPIVAAAAVVEDALGVDDAERLLVWLQDHPDGTIDLSRCRHLHAANLQVLMAARATPASLAGRPRIVAWPAEPTLRSWLEAALGS